jgi:hypothetical protein
MVGHLGLKNPSIDRNFFHTHHALESLKFINYENLKNYKFLIPKTIKTTNLEEYRILNPNDHGDHKPQRI